MHTNQLEENYIPFQCMIISHVNRLNLEGVASAQYDLLNILDATGSKTTKELSDIRGISQSGISKLTKRLIDKGFIEQERSHADRRSYNITVTTEGKNFLKRAAALRNEILTAIEHSLTDEEQREFASLCRKITDGAS